MKTGKRTFMNRSFIWGLNIFQESFPFLTSIQRRLFPRVFLWYDGSISTNTNTDINIKVI